jgi:hypothetical protein
MVAAHVIRLELLRHLRRISLAAALALGSVAVLLEAGANYSAEVREAGTLARERTDFERAAASVLAPYSFSLSASLSLDGARMRCGDDARADPAPQRADGQFDINCVAASTATAAGAWPRAELQSSPGDSRYDRAVRF